MTEPTPSKISVVGKLRCLQVIVALGVAAAVWLILSLEVVTISLDRSGYTLVGNIETGFMRIDTGSGSIALCNYDGGNRATCLRWRE